METEVTPIFTEPETLATFLGENIGTHYSAALRAADAYGRHLAGQQESLRAATFSGEGLARFWTDLIRVEDVRIGSTAVLKKLSTHPRYYFTHFLDTADAVYGRSYEDAPPQLQKKLGQTQHAQCLRLLRDPEGEGMRDRFMVQNWASTWSQMLRISGGAPE
jgi:hypothetical protein